MEKGCFLLMFHCMFIFCDVCIIRLNVYVYTNMEDLVKIKQINQISKSSVVRIKTPGQHLNQSYHHNHQNCNYNLNQLHIALTNHQHHHHHLNPQN